MSKKQDFPEKVKQMITKIVKKDFNEENFRDKLREAVSKHIKEDLL